MDLSFSHLRLREIALIYYGIMVFVIETVLAYVKAFCQCADRLEVCGAVLNSYDSVPIVKQRMSSRLNAVPNWTS